MPIVDTLTPSPRAARLTSAGGARKGAKPVKRPQGLPEQAAPRQFHQRPAACNASCCDFTPPHAASLDPLTPGSASEPSTPVHADSNSSCWGPAVPYPLLRATTTPCLTSADQFCRLQVTRIFYFVQRSHARLGPALRRRAPVQLPSACAHVISYLEPSPSLRDPVS